jgi:hypothetical protein
MQLYFRCLEVFSHSFIAVISHIIIEDMNPVFPWVGFFYFSKKTDCASALKQIVSSKVKFCFNLSYSAIHSRVLASWILCIR